MKAKNILLTFSVVLLAGIVSCTSEKSPKTLFDGTNLDLWTTQGEVFVNEQTLTLNNDASIILKQGNYDNFELTVSARTVDNGKGFIGFHTDKNGNGGYKVALNNDLENAQWWTKTGSLLAVRNLTKSVVNTNEWFDMVIRVEAKTITVKINDQPVVEYIELATPYRTAENTDQLLSKGTIIVKNTGDGTIEIKSMELAPIDNSNIDIAAQQANAIDETTDDIIKLHQANFPVLDYHVHIKGDLTNESAAAQSRKYGINYALAPNCGIGFPIQTNEEVFAYIESMKDAPFVQAMQGEGREWPTTFSPEVRAQFDYVFTDAMTFTDPKGNRTRLWMPEEVFIDNEQEYMDLIVEKIVEVVTNEPFDVYVNPNFLPDQLNDRYDKFWTEERQNKVIEALVSSGKALEINHRYKIPNKAFIQKAKEAGLKFTFGTNNMDSNFGKLEYCIQMMNECGITAQDMFKPKMK